MILTKRLVLVVINAMIGYQLGNLTVVPKCPQNHGATVHVASKRKLFFIAILRSDFLTVDTSTKSFFTLYLKVRQSTQSAKKLLPKHG